jgi:hypothetical protein
MFRRQLTYNIRRYSDNHSRMKKKLDTQINIRVQENNKIIQKDIYLICICNLLNSFAILAGNCI